MNHGARKAALAAGLALAGLYPGLAWAADEQPVAAPDQDSLSSGDIIVTARRKEESLKDVPQTVAVVTGASLEKLNIQNLNDLGKVVAGLDVSGNQASMRGVTFGVAAATSQTVASYINDAPVQGDQIFRQSFDVGQIEVLRGPQGTLRGIAAPSGAITLTTRRADLNELGVNVVMTLNNHDGYNAQAGVGIPIIPGMLAVRFAGLFDYTDANGVRSVTNPRKPHTDTKAGRVSVRFEPTTNLSFNVMYNELHSSGINFGTAVFGSGSPGNTQAGVNNPNISPGYNGPVIGIFDREAVVGYPIVTDTTNKILTGQAEWSFAGQKLSYVGSWQRTFDLANTLADQGNLLLGYPLPGIRFPNVDTIKTHELRLSSRDRIAGIFDYVVGVFHRNDFANVNGNAGYAALLAGAFGPPGTAAVPGTPVNPRYAISLPIVFPVSTKETSFFANVTAHFGDRLEISGGVRRIDLHLHRHVTTGSADAFNAVALPPAFQALCTLPKTVPGGLGGVASPVYAGACDIPIPGTTVDINRNEQFKPWLYDAAISYHITPELMIYAHTGSSWRQPPVSTGLSNPTNSPDLSRIILGGPEKSKSYEAGVKWSFLAGRGHLFADYYHQTYDGFIYSVPGGLRFLTGLPSAANNFNGTVSSPLGAAVNAPAKIDGFEVEAGLRVNDRLEVSGNFSWAKGKVSGPLPCNDGNLDGVPDNNNPPNYGALLAAKGIGFATCNITPNTSTSPRWNLRMTAEYDQPVTPDVDLFVRGLFQYQPKNPNADLVYTQPAYGMLDLWAGIHVPAHNLEVAFYGKNITGTREILNDVTATDIGASYLRALFGTSGYKAITLTPRREFGVTARIAFGSR